MLSFSKDNQSDVIEAFNSTSRYLDDLLNIGNNFFDSMINRIYPSELQLNKANLSDTETLFWIYIYLCHGLLKNPSCLSRGSNRRPFDLQSSTLPRRYKSRLVPQGSTSVL